MCVAQIKSSLLTLYAFNLLLANEEARVVALKHLLHDGKELVTRGNCVLWVELVL